MMKPAADCRATGNTSLVEKKMTTYQLSRRTMLRGLGVSMALPWMESLHVWGDESTGKNSASQAPTRMAILFAGCGFHRQEWWAKGEGKSMELGKVLTSLSDFRDRMVFIRGLYNAEALKGNIHSSQTGNLLSGAPLAAGARRRSRWGRSTGRPRSR